MSKQQIRKIFNTTFYKRVKRSQRLFRYRIQNKISEIMGEDELSCLFDDLSCLFFGYPKKNEVSIFFRPCL